jgi:hypothetical protein
MAAATTPAAQLLATLRGRRQIRVEVEPGRFLLLYRPREDEFGRWRYPTAELVAAAVYGWEGFSPAFFLGESVGASDPLEYEAALVDEALRDRLHWLTACIEAVTKAIEKHIDQRQAAAKN